MKTPGVSAKRPSPCIARQPILTADENLVGYELFFRESSEDPGFSSDQEQATSTIIDTLNLVGLDVLCNGYLAFINCTHQMLLAEYFSLLPPEGIVVEIQETVSADEGAIQACQRLKQAGFSICLDNFVTGDPREALVPYADFIKIDIGRVAAAECEALVALHASAQRRMIAHKVEQRQQFWAAKSYGFTIFQGYFLRLPENLQTRQIPASQASYVRLLSAISRSEVDFDEVEVLIKREPSLCYGLLRYLNSPLLGLSSPVLSVRHALSLLGERESTRWIRLATTLVMGQNKSPELVLSSLVRARFCELIGPKVEHGKSDLFLMGMLSLMDAILAVPIGVVIGELALDPEIKAQLLGAKAGRATSLSPIYDLMVAREAGDWGLVTKVAKKLNLSLSFVGECSTEAMKWAYEITNAAKPPGSSKAATAK